MQHNIRRNNKIQDYLIQQMNRIDWNMPLELFFNQHIFPKLSLSESREVLDSTKNGFSIDVLDNDTVLIETLKFIGLMELSTNPAELTALIARRNEIKTGGRELTDFDKILQGIMKVPNKK